MCHWLADQVFEGNPFDHPTFIVIVHPYKLYPRVLPLHLKESQGPVAQKVVEDLSTMREMQPSPKAPPLQFQIRQFYASAPILSATVVHLIVMAIVRIKYGKDVMLSALQDTHFPRPPVAISTPRKDPQVLLALPLPYLLPGWFACLNRLP